MEVSIGQQQKKSSKRLLHTLYFISLMVYFYFLIGGLSFYITPFPERPHHEAYRSLRPAGNIGHGFGIIGSAMMLIMLLYSVRKRSKFFRNWGKLSHWLDMHIYLGIMGPLLVILHTSFKVQGLVAVSFWSMIAVALSGILGRYLYIQIPRNIRGEELNIQELEKMEQEFAQQLKRQYGLSERLLERLDKELSPRLTKEQSLLGAFLSMMIDDFLRPLKYRRIRKALARLLNVPPREVGELLNLSRRKTLLHRRIILWQQVHQLFHYWHVIHKPFALVMYFIMFVHIGITVWLGYTWIF